MVEQLSFFEDTKYVLMSLKEESYERILTGKKTYEYRTKYMNEETTAFIYLSKVRKVVGAIIEFGYPIVGSSEEIASMAEQQEPGCYSRMMEYFKSGKGYALPIKKVTEIPPIPLASLVAIFPKFMAPQSYYILNKKPELLEYLQNYNLVK